MGVAGLCLATGLGAGPVLAADEAVTIAGSAFDPGTVTVTVGESVTWTNRDGRSHTATADDGSFDTGGISTGGSEAVTFATAGTLAYHCSIHPDMTGRVVVVSAAGTAPPTDTTADVAGVRSAGPESWALGAVLVAAVLVATALLRRAKSRIETGVVVGRARQD